MNNVTNTIEELSLNAWPALQTKLYDDWVLRFANGYTKRSNSVNPLYPGTIPLNEKIAICEETYRNQKLPTIFKLTGDSHPDGIDAELEKRGYLRLDETSVRVMEMKQYQYRKPEGVLNEDSFNKDWFEAFIKCSGLDEQLFQNAAKTMLHSILGQVIVVRKTVDRQTVGCGFGAIERGHIGIFDIIVAKEHRGNGYGRDIMDGILSAAADQTIERAYLSVIAGNLPAETLYQSLGFEEIYRYWYRKKG